MRLIAGEFRSRKIVSIPGFATDPTPDDLRETLFTTFNIVPDPDIISGSGVTDWCRQADRCA